jgi:TM2 domain-containing membrane protein YozV
MYCKNCGNSMDISQPVCTRCGSAKGNGNSFCPACGWRHEPGAENCPNCGCGLKNQTAAGGKSKLAAGLLGIFLGNLGVHNFYLGYTGKAWAQLLITVLSFGTLSFISAIWGLIEGILYLTGHYTVDANGLPLRD